MTSVNLRRTAQTGPPIRTLLLHGVAGSRRDWDGFVSRAHAQLELWDIELPWAATGNGSWAMAADIPQIVGDILDSLPPASPDRPVADLVVAHSFAASALLELLARGTAPAIGKVVLVAPLACPEPFDWSEIGRRVDEFPKLLEEGIVHRAGHRITAETCRDLALRLRDLLGPMQWLRTYEYGLRSKLLDVEQVRLPALVVAGTGDRVVAAADAERLCRRLPDARFELFDRCGHLPMVDRAGEFSEVVNDFVAAGLPVPG